MDPKNYESYRKELRMYEAKFEDYRLSNKTIIQKTISIIFEKEKMFTNEDLEKITGIDSVVISTITGRYLHKGIIRDLGVRSRKYKIFGRGGGSD